MPVEVKGALAARKALKQFSPELLKESNKELAALLRQVTSVAKGFVPSVSPLSGWANEVGKWESRAFDVSSIKRGITYSTSPSKPNKRGFRTLAAIYNKSAAGAIYETAGRKNPSGQQAARRVTGWTGGAHGKGSIGQVWETGREINGSANPNAGRQFIDAINATGKLVDIQDPHLAGRRTRKTRGRLIFRAWQQEGKRLNPLIIKSIENTKNRVIQVQNASMTKVEWKSK